MNHRYRTAQRGQVTAGYVVVVALGLIAIWAAWMLLATAIGQYHDRFAFAIGLPVI